MPTTSPENGRSDPLAYWTRRRADQSSGPFWWTCAILSTVMAVLFVLGALFVLGVKIFAKPQLPQIRVDSARLDLLNYHHGVLEGVQFSINAVVENGNTKTALSFSDVSFNISFHKTVVLLTLASGPFDVPRRTLRALNYTALSRATLPLDGAMEEALKKRLVPFTLAGVARTHWKEGALVVFKTWTRLACNLVFDWPSGTAEEISCTSPSRL